MSAQRVDERHTVDSNIYTSQGRNGFNNYELYVKGALKEELLDSSMSIVQKSLLRGTAIVPVILLRSFPAFMKLAKTIQRRKKTINVIYLLHDFVVLPSVKVNLGKKLSRVAVNEIYFPLKENILDIILALFRATYSASNCIELYCYVDSLNVKSFSQVYSRFSRLAKNLRIKFLYWKKNYTVKTYKDLKSSITESRYINDAVSYEFMSSQIYCTFGNSPFHLMTFRDASDIFFLEGLVMCNEEVSYSNSVVHISTFGNLIAEQVFLLSKRVSPSLCSRLSSLRYFYNFSLIENTALVGRRLAYLYSILSGDIVHHSIDIALSFSEPDFDNQYLLLRIAWLYREILSKKKFSVSGRSYFKLMYSTTSTDWVKVFRPDNFFIKFSRLFIVSLSSFSRTWSWQDEFEDHINYFDRYRKQIASHIPKNESLLRKYS